MAVDLLVLEWLVDGWLLDSLVPAELCAELLGALLDGCDDDGGWLELC